MRKAQPKSEQDEKRKDEEETVVELERKQEILEETEKEVNPGTLDPVQVEDKAESRAGSGTQPSTLGRELSLEK